MSNARNLARLLPNASGQLPDAAMASGSVLQVVQGIKTDTSVYSGVDAYHTIVSASITPISTSSKILVQVACQYCPGTAGTQYEWMFYLDRNGTQIGQGSNPSSRQSSLFQPNTAMSSGFMMTSGGGILLDSPNSTSLLTYSLKFRSHTVPMYVNRSESDNDSSSYSKRGITTITLTEVSG